MVPLSEMPQVQVTQLVNDLYGWTANLGTTHPPSRAVSGYPRAPVRILCFPNMQPLIDGKAPSWRPDYIPATVKTIETKSVEAMLELTSMADSSSIPIEGLEFNSLRDVSARKRSLDHGHLASVTSEGQLRIWEIVARFEKCGILAPLTSFD
jgi:hypothetical protein